MAESAGEKTEEATPKKMREARRKGQIAKSKDMTTAALFISAFAIVAVTAGNSGKVLMEYMNFIFESTARNIDETVIFSILSGALSAQVKILAPLLAGVFIIALVGSYLQVGSLFALEPLKPSLDKLNPIKGVKNIFSLKSFIEFLKSSIKLSLAFLMAYLIFKGAFRDIYLTVTSSLDQTIALTGHLIVKLVMRIGFIFIAVAGADFYYQKWQYKKDMRMTKDEVKREYKQEEGDPTYKSKRKAMHQELAMNNMVNEVKNADAVITNPDEIAVAIKYDADKMNAPQITAKGQRLWAEKIKAIAKENDIPVFRNISLAQALNKMEIGSEIPEELYEAVAEILQVVYRMAQQEE